MMLQGIAGFFRKADVDTRITVASLILLIVTWAMDFLRFGPSFERFSFLFILVLVLAFYMLVVSDRMRLERNLDQRTTLGLAQIAEMLDSRLPAIEFIDDEARIELEMVRAVNEAEDFIAVTGGKARLERYLQAIQRRVEDDSIPYCRVFLGREITHELCEHSRSLLAYSLLVSIGLQHQIDLGYIFATEKLVIIFLPHPHTKAFRTCMKVPDPKIAQMYKEYIHMLYARGEKIETENQVKELCEQCRSP